MIDSILCENGSKFDPKTNMNFVSGQRGKKMKLFKYYSRFPNFKITDISFCLGLTKQPQLQPY